MLLARYEQIAWQLFAEGGFGEIGQTRSPRRDGHGAVQRLIQSSRHYRTTESIAGPLKGVDVQPQHSDRKS